jgi:hypothetical protein
MKSDANRREFTRVPIQLNVEVTPTQAGNTSYQVKDVSLKGLYLHCENPLPVGAACRVALLLGDKDNPVRIEVGGKVARVDKTGMGLEITDIIGVQSFEHLRNLVLYNSPDPNQVEQEFQDHIGIKQRK